MATKIRFFLLCEQFKTFLQWANVMVILLVCLFLALPKTVLM